MLTPLGYNVLVPEGSANDTANFNVRSVSRTSYGKIIPTTMLWSISGWMYNSSAHCTYEEF